MSRICVKNLPKYVKEDRLREVFSKKGEITDLKLMRTEDGKSRQFAFLGFRTELEAQEVIKYFNKSFLDTCRISCEIARKVGDPDMPRPWSRYSKKKEQNVTESGIEVSTEKNTSLYGTQEVKKTNIKGIENDDPQLQEFFQVMQPRTKSKLWSNDTLVAPTVEKNNIINRKEAQSKKEGKQKSVLANDELNKNNTQSKKEGKQKSVLADGELNKNNTSEAEKSISVAQNEVISDVDYFKSRVKKEWSDSESETSHDDDHDGNNKDEDSDGDSSEKSDTMKESLKGKKVNKLDQHGQDYIKGVDQLEVETKAPSPDTDREILNPENPSSNLNDEFVEAGRLFIRNLPYTATEDELEEHFSRFGNISEVHLVVDKDTKRSKGIAYIQYTLPKSAIRALEELDSSIFQGRLLHVMPAKKKNSSDKQEVHDHAKDGLKTFKQRREEKRRSSELGGNTRAWNTLFMRSDTVVEYVARRLGVSKSNLLDREAGDLAVRVALIETQVMEETKKAFANVGVNISSLEEFASGKTDGKRSNHVLLVKNLPYGTSEGELSKMFGKFGSVDKIILPPTKTLALVVFLEPSEARAAREGLVYKRYKDVPLYLEWAPYNIFDQNPTSKSTKDGNIAVGEVDAKRVMLGQSVEDISELEIDPDRNESTSLYVKNLNFKTSDESLKQHFKEQMKGGNIRSVRIRKHLKNGKNLSMGFGFIEFDGVDTATSVCTDLQGTVLDGHALILQLCHGKKDEEVRKKVDKDKSSSKLLVKNVAFEATEKDVRQLFSPFGQIKSLRLPKKFGKYRGFAFVEYVTKQEAQNALSALASTHLYGRHLVLERAMEGETLEELRSRTAAQFTEQHTPAKASKKRKNMSVLDQGTMKFHKISP